MEDQYQELKTGIRKHLNSAAEDFFMVGYFLRQISEGMLFREDGYKSIWEFAKGEYGLSTSSASRFMAINARFSVDGGENMAEKYIGMGVSRLQEMLGLPDEELEKVTKEMTVREIRAMKKKQETPFSYYGFPKTERPEDSVIATPGCGDGKYDCFSCCRECAIRQEPRHCRTAPLGNPFPCTRVNNEEWKKDMADGLYEDRCQFLHPELAPVREGDGESNPCCLTCKHKTCSGRCDVATKKDEEERKEVQAEVGKQCDAEASRPEPNDKDIKAFYDWCRFKTTDIITAAALKDRYRNAGGGGGRELVNYRGSARGIRINYKREITWVQLAKRLIGIQEAEKKKEAMAAVEVKAGEPADPDIMDANFREAPDEPKPHADMDDKQKKQLLKDKEPEFIEAFYKSLYPGEREILKSRKAAKITKMFKEEHGQSYDGDRNDDGILWNCYPDKINFSISGLGLPYQITWGQFTTKLLNYLEEHPELETWEPEPEPCDTCEPNEEDCVGKTTHENSCMGYEEKNQEEAGAEPSPEEYTCHDVKVILEREKGYLKDGRKADAPAKFIRKEKILVDALTLLLESMGGDEE